MSGPMGGVWGSRGCSRGPPHQLAPALGVTPQAPASQPDPCPCRLADLVHFDVPSIHVELGSALRLGPLEHVRRHSVAEKRDSEEESESTAL